MIPENVTDLQPQMAITLTCRQHEENIMRYVLMLCLLALSAPSQAFLGFGVDCKSAADCLRKGDMAFQMSPGASCKDALEYYEEACDEYGSGKGCFDAATCYAFELGKSSKARKYYGKACKKGNSSACVFEKMN
jgi:hypothetical protein